MKIARYLDENSPWQYKAWLDNNLWLGAKERWQEATVDQQLDIIARITSIWEDDAYVDEREINNFIWFRCDDIFFPEDESQPADFTDLTFEVEPN